MRVDARQVIPARLRRPFLVALAVAAVVGLPTGLAMLLGHKPALEVVLDPPAYLVVAGAMIPLRLRVDPPGASGVKLSWEGQGVEQAVGGAHWLAPTESGAYTVTVKARRGAARAEDSVTFQVVDRPLTRYPLVRPPPRHPPPVLPPCSEEVRPLVVLHGERCRGGNLVVQITGAPGARIWHWLGTPGRAGDAAPGMSGEVAGRGAWVNISLPGEAGPPLELVSLVVPSGGGCATTLKTPVSPGSCQAGPGSGPLFADFAHQVLGPGYVRLVAKPPREPALCPKYLWDFGDGRRKETTRPRVTHRFDDPGQRWHLVRLSLEAPSGRASTIRVVEDRFAIKDRLTAEGIK